ncbi:MAG TPA: SgcJ/EcaC family oxidoreductase [Thermoanaerobaculia bacterium]|nr:SgcJ/EcaC family oxidoreductase [Thermoanaerobaculia bacterium]
MLDAWGNFYVIIGSSAAALTGLMFVVIALMPVTRVQRDIKALEAFASPTIVHFSAVLVIGAILMMPQHTLESLRATLVVAGLAGVAFAMLVIRRTLHQKSYAPEFEDWAWHAVLPTIAYLTLLVSSFFIVADTDGALVGVASAALLLLFIGIHNAWDAAVWMTTAGEIMEDDDAAIRDVIDRWQRATKTADLDAVLKLMTDDVVFLRAGQPTMNKEAFKQSFRGFTGQTRFEAKQDIKEIRAAGDLAYCWSHLTLTMGDKTRAGDILTIFRKIDGKWLLSRDANFVA